MDLRDNMQISERCFKWIASSCNQLVSLDLSFCQRTTNTGIQDLAMGTPNLTSLDLSNCPQVNDTAFLHKLTSFEALERCSLRGCSQVTDNAVLALVKASRELKIINVTNCPSITKKSQIFVQSLRRKMHLDISKSPEERSIVQPGTFGKPKAVEVPWRERFTSGPAPSTEITEVIGGLNRRLSGSNKSPTSSRASLAEGASNANVSVNNILKSRLMRKKSL